MRPVDIAKVLKIGRASVYRNGFERPTSRAPGFPAILAVVR
jgi:hypothetical protein